MNLFAGSIANSIFFYVYEDGKKRYGFDPKQPYSWRTVLISYQAGFLSSAVTTPLWTVKTRMMLFQEYGHIEKVNSINIFCQVCKDMYLNEGLKSFYRGFVPSLFMCNYGVIQMYSYETLCYTFNYDSGTAKKISWNNMIVPFLIGGTARSVASTVLLPVNVVRMRLQMKTYSEEEMKAKNLKAAETNNKDRIMYKGTLDAFSKIYRNEGLLGFYKGFTPSLLRIFPTSGIFFLFYELTLSTLSRRDEKE